MLTINTIDLWTEQYKNHYECFKGAFVDGFEKNKNPFNKYKIVKNCNCVITTNMEDINISNKHNAIIFYNNDKPVRLIVINKDTEIFAIEHKCAFINETKTRIIPIQENSRLTNN